MLCLPLSRCDKGNHELGSFLRVNHFLVSFRKLVCVCVCVCVCVFSRMVDEKGMLTNFCVLVSRDQRLWLLFQSVCVNYGNNVL